MRADKPDQKAIEEVIEGISAMQNDMQRGIVDHMLAEKALLEPEQQKKFLDLIERKMVTGGSAGCPPVEQSQ
jgi:Spy/CpxP family protein refolding chaperone